MKHQVDKFDLSEADLLISETPDILGDDNELQEKIDKSKTVDGDQEIKPTTASFGKKTIKHFLQERNISEILDIHGFTSQEGFCDSDQLNYLIDLLIKDKRREFTLGKGRKAGGILIWKRRASRVPLLDLSLFQLVCTMKESMLVAKYLEQGVDVNGPIEITYNGEFSGRSPLHLALSHIASLSDSQQKLLTTYLLLHKGANVHAKDGQGNTPLHALFSGAPFYKQLFSIVMENGADNRAVNNCGETAFELLVTSSSNLDIENYMEAGGCINRFNSISRQGCIPKIIRRVPAKRIGFALSLMEVDSQRRTSIHNIVSFSFSEMKDAANDELYYNDLQTIIESILQQGGDIDYQDESGKTPLHYATGFRNSQSVSVLLRLGADINVCDIFGKSALTSSLDFFTISTEEMMRNDRVIKTFMVHLHKLKISGLLISHENVENFYRASIKYEKDTVGEINFHSELEQSKDALIGKSILHDSMSETGIISSYPRLLQRDRDDIDHYLKNFHPKDFLDSSGFQRVEQAKFMFVKPAENPLNDLINNYLEDSCADYIFKYLKKNDVENSILLTSAGKLVNTETDVYYIKL